MKDQQANGINLPIELYQKLLALAGKKGNI